MESAERANTRSTMSNLMMAMQAYVGEYGHLPRADDQALFSILKGEDRDGQNPRHVIFIQFREPKKLLFWTTHRGELDEKGKCIDGWGHPLQIKGLHGDAPVTITSYGKNGRDDGGNGDDLTLIVPVEPLHAPVLVNPTWQPVAPRNPEHQQVLASWYSFASILAITSSMFLSPLVLLIRRIKKGRE